MVSEMAALLRGLIDGSHPSFSAFFFVSHRDYRLCFLLYESLEPFRPPLS